VTFLGLYFWHVSHLTTRKTSSEQRSLAIGASIAVIAILAHSWGDFNLHIPANALFFVTLIGFTVAMDDPQSRFPRSTLGKPAKIALGLVLLLLGTGGFWIMGKAMLSTYYNSKGLLAKESAYWDQALIEFQRSINADPGNPQPYANSGDVYRSMSIWRIDPARSQEREALARAAVDSFEASLSRNPFQTSVYVTLSNVYEMLGDMEKARTTLEQGLTVDPKSSFVYLRLGLLYRKLGEEEKAAAAFQMAEELNPGGDDISRFHLEEIRPRKPLSSETSETSGPSDQ
jgi:hypothetical protein